MKKFLFSLFLISFIVVGANAQKASCSHSCTKSASACTTKVPSSSAAGIENSAAAEKVAAMDETIETRKDPITGEMYYVRKETSSTDGTVSFVNVSFDSEANAFVNVAPAAVEGTNHCTSGKATTSSGKACCASGASSGKACCAGKAASTTSTTTTTQKIKS